MTETAVIKNTITCKNCGSENVVKFGTYKLVQRYWCKSCKRKFKADDSLFHSKVAANSISSALTMYHCDESIDDIRRYLRDVLDYYPSKSVVARWIKKYADIAYKTLRGYKPIVGNKWVLDDNEVAITNKKVWIFIVTDIKTDYLLAVRVSTNRTSEDLRIVLQKAIDISGRIPQSVATDEFADLLKNINFIGSGDAAVSIKHILHEEVRLRRAMEELWDRILRRNFKNMDSLTVFMNRQMIHHNFFSQHNSINGMTPAQAAGINCPYRSWADVIRQPVSKYAESRSHNKTKPAKNRTLKFRELLS